MSDDSAAPERADTSKSTRTRERILDAAAFVLSRKGYAGTRLSDVAAQAEVQAPAIYYYFESRDALIEEVMWVGAHRVRAHVEEVLAGLPEDTSPMDRILEAVAAHLRYELHICDYATASIRNAGQVPEHVRLRPAAEEATYSRIWRDLFAQAKKAGQLRPDLDINVSRMLLLGSMNWAAEWWNPKMRSLNDLVKATQDFVRHGMGAVDLDDPTHG
ncbi:TetR/AcrR family transcriptional regulator [Pseudenhygromyxa sp. WMMC2535]|uniref:TetR/AcrR family transcriptional regulator n=1 Tax=Pseudenhygromyxa sp. WMMC2535 TaxID=2712867 RepID=UPI0015532B90|nr:TetR/AcrR family transcriptional regulator [Pseudenhygromyxa sp. WMMC2535]NVB42596.1 TetR/AcrR family transcriptional regulator [Pseudenhygromyxa sp. WMMC2535]